MLPLFTLLRRIVEPTPFLPPSFPSPEIALFWGIFICHHPLYYSKGTSNPRGGEVFHWVISSNLHPFNDPDTPTLIHCCTDRCSSPDISFASPSLVLSCFWEVLQDLGSDHLLILLTIPLSSVFLSNERYPSFNFSDGSFE